MSLGQQPADICPLEAGPVGTGRLGHPGNKGLQAFLLPWHHCQQLASLPAVCRRPSSSPLQGSPLNSGPTSGQSLLASPFHNTQQSMVVTPALGEEAFQAGAGGCSLQAVLSSLVSSLPSVDDPLLASNSFHCISQFK